jgi:predicted metal-binding protein
MDVRCECPGESRCFTFLRVNRKKLRKILSFYYVVRAGEGTRTLAILLGKQNRWKD